jgi:hypothetical protein
MTHSSTQRQYSGDSYFREQVFIQTNSHGTFLWILKPVSATLASHFTQTFPQVSLTMQRFLSWRGGRSCTPGDPHSHLQCRSGFVVCQQHPVVIRRRGVRSQVAAASTSKSQDWLWQHSLQRGRQARFLGSGLSLYTQGWSHHPLSALPP